jgi:hypothetical protein
LKQRRRRSIEQQAEQAQAEIDRTASRTAQAEIDRTASRTGAGGDGLNNKENQTEAAQKHNCTKGS